MTRDSLNSPQGQQAYAPVERVPETTAPRQANPTGPQQSKAKSAQHTSLFSAKKRRDDPIAAAAGLSSVRKGIVLVRAGFVIAIVSLAILIVFVGIFPANPQTSPEDPLGILIFLAPVWLLALGLQLVGRFLCCQTSRSFGLISLARLSLLLVVAALVAGVLSCLTTVLPKFARFTPLAWLAFAHVTNTLSSALFAGFLAQVAARLKQTVEVVLGVLCVFSLICLIFLPFGLGLSLMKALSEDPQSAVLASNIQMLGLYGLATLACALTFAVAYSIVLFRLPGHVDSFLASDKHTA